MAEERGIIIIIIIIIIRKGRNTQVPCSFAAWAPNIAACSDVGVKLNGTQ